jgi:hypothetical protein
VVKIRAGLDSAYVRPGHVAKVLDPKKAGVRFGGRVVSATVNNVEIDAPVTIEAGKTYTLDCVNADDGAILTRTVNNAPGETSLLTVAVVYATPPAPQSVWVLTRNDLSAQLFRVLQATESRGEFSVVALSHNPNKYGAIEQGLSLETPNVLGVIDPRAIERPRNLSFIDRPNGGTLSWEAPIASLVERYRVEIKLYSFTGNWDLIGYSDSTSITISTVPGLYDVRVRGENAVAAGTWGETRVRHQAPAIAPATVTGVTVQFDGDETVLRWDDHPEERVRNGGIIEIRSFMDQGAYVDAGGAMLNSILDYDAPTFPTYYPSVTYDQAWDWSSVGERLPGTATSARFRGLGYVTLIRVRDRFGQWSDVVPVDTARIEANAPSRFLPIDPRLPYRADAPMPPLSFAGSELEVTYNVPLVAGTADMNGAPKWIRNLIIDYRTINGDENWDSAEFVDSEEFVDPVNSTVTCEILVNGVRQLGGVADISGTFTSPSPPTIALKFKREKLVDNFKLWLVESYFLQQPIRQGDKRDVNNVTSGALETFTFRFAYTDPPAVSPTINAPTTGRNSGTIDDRGNVTNLTKTQVTIDYDFSPTFTGGGQTVTVGHLADGV